jgi:hypothetical protein
MNQLWENNSSPSTCNGSSAHAILSSFRCLGNLPSVNRKVELIEGLVQIDAGELAVIKKSKVLRANTWDPEPHRASTEAFVDRYRLAKLRTCRINVEKGSELKDCPRAPSARSVYGACAFSVKPEFPSRQSRSNLVYRGVENPTLKRYMNLTQDEALHAD